MTASVDILLPAYNAFGTLRETIVSLQAQTFGDFTVQLVNDGSTDGTGELAHQLAATEPRVVVHDKPNGGIVEAMNFGLLRCRAEFVARIDADDLAYPERLAVQLAYLRANPDVVGVGAAMRHIDGVGRPIGSIGRMGSPDNADAFFLPSKEPYLIHPVITVRRLALEAVGGYREVHYAEDTDLYWRLRGKGRLINLPDILGDYRMHQGSVSSASIVNGRIMAVSSQLAALSERRRLAGVEDLEFRRSDMATFKRVKSFGAMLDHVSPYLTTDERRHLRLAAVAKLLELTAYRPYEADADDCVLIGTVACDFAGLPPVNRGLLNRQVAGAAARIALAGRMDDARAMVPAALYPSFIARYAARRALPERMRRALRRPGTKSAPVK